MYYSYIYFCSTYKISLPILLQDFPLYQLTVRKLKVRKKFFPLFKSVFKTRQFLPNPVNMLSEYNFKNLAVKKTLRAASCKSSFSLGSSFPKFCTCAKQNLERKKYISPSFFIDPLIF